MGPREPFSATLDLRRSAFESIKPLTLKKQLKPQISRMTRMKKIFALERAFTRRVSAEESPASRESGYHPCDPCHPWFLNSRI